MWGAGASVVPEGVKEENRVNTHLGRKSQQVLETEWTWGGQGGFQDNSQVSLSDGWWLDTGREDLWGENNVSREKFHKGLSYSLEEIK